MPTSTSDLRCRTRRADSRALANRPSIQPGILIALEMAKFRINVIHIAGSMLYRIFKKDGQNVSNFDVSAVLSKKFPVRGINGK